MKLNRLFLSFGVMALAAACGGGGGGGSGNTTTNTQSASSTVSSTGMLQSAIGSMNGSGASGALNQIGASAQSIVQYAPEGAQGAMVAINDVVRELDRASHDFGTDVASAAPGDCICDESGNCTFDMCGGGGYTMSGTITKSGDVYAVDVTMDLNSGGAMYHWVYTGSVTMTATLISGDLHGAGEGTVSGGGQTITYNFDWDVTYNDIGLDGTGCATSGSLDAHVSFSVDGTGGAGNYSGDATVTFGPACGTATAS